jgi:hypothetical protein
MGPKFGLRPSLFSNCFVFEADMTDIERRYRPISERILASECALGGDDRRHQRGAVLRLHQRCGAVLRVHQRRGGARRRHPRGRAGPAPRARRARRRPPPPPAARRGLLGSKRPTAPPPPPRGRRARGRRRGRRAPRRDLGSKRPRPCRPSMSPRRRPSRRRRRWACGGNASARPLATGRATPARGLRTRTR